MSSTPISLRKTVVPVSYGIEIEGRSTHLRRNFLHSHVGFFFVTTDGSLSFENSIELVSQPLPVNMLIRCLESFKKRNGEIEYEHEAGIHIHITRTERTEKRLMEFYSYLYRNRYQDFSIFFKRSENYYARWSVDPDSVFNGSERYTAINFRNANTIEVRAFGNKLHHISGITAGIVFLKRLDYLLNSKKPISTKLLEEIITKFPLH